MLVGRGFRRREGGRGGHDNIPRANSHRTRPSLFALVRCQPRKQCGPRTRSRGIKWRRNTKHAGILTLRYPQRLVSKRIFRLLLCTYTHVHVTDCFSTVSTTLSSRGSSHRDVIERRYNLYRGRRRKILSKYLFRAKDLTFKIDFGILTLKSC